MSNGMSFKGGYICVYDSGIGGLTTLNEIIKLLPNENYLYFADDKNCPYGNKSNEEISWLVLENVKWLLKLYNIKMLVFGCNTATSCSIQDLRAQYGFDIVGIEPAIKPAMENSKNKEVLVIMTNATSKQEKYKKLVKKVYGKVHSVGLNDFATEVEKAVLKGESVCLNKYISLITDILNKNDKIDSLVLGCTHYVYYKKDFYKKLGLKVYDGNEGVAKRVAELILKKNNYNESVGQIKILLSSRDKAKQKSYKKILENLKKAE